jgi:hypothetical protein
MRSVDLLNRYLNSSNPDQVIFNGICHMVDKYNLETLRSIYSNAQKIYLQTTGLALNDAVRNLAEREPAEPVEWVAYALIILMKQVEADKKAFKEANKEAKTAKPEPRWVDDYNLDSIAGEHAMMAFMGEW